MADEPQHHSNHLSHSRPHPSSHAHSAPTSTNPRASAQDVNIHTLLRWAPKPQASDHYHKHVSDSQVSNSYAPLHAKAPFSAAENRPQTHDGVFRVVVVAAGAEGSRFIPAIVSGLTKDPTIAVQILASPDALRFVDQPPVDDAVRHAWNLASRSEAQWGVKVWTEADEWAGWTRPGDSVLHRELRKWADLVVVAPCSADMMAKIASGLSENVALSLIRALPPSTPIMLCPAMNSDMYSNAFTRRHLTTLRDELHCVVVGTKDGSRSSAGEGPGSMADWRDIVIAVQDMAALFHMRQQQRAAAGETLVPDDEAALKPKNVLAPQPDPNEPGPQGNLSSNFRELAALGKIGHPFSLWKPIWGEATIPHTSQSIQDVYFPVPGLPTYRSEHDRIQDRQSHDAGPVSKSDPNPDAYATVASGIYWETRWWMS